MNEFRLDILNQAHGEMHKKFVETNEDIYSIVKLLLSIEMERVKESSGTRSTVSKE